MNLYWFNSHSSRSHARWCASLFVRYDQVLFVGIDHKHGQQAGGLSVTGIGTDDMMIARDFGPALAGAIHLFRTVIDFAPNPPLQDRGIDERRLWMGMRGIRATRRVFDQHAFHTLAGHIRKGAIKDQRDLGLISTYQYRRHVIG